MSANQLRSPYNYSRRRSTCCSSTSSAGRRRRIPDSNLCRSFSNSPLRICNACFYRVFSLFCNGIFVSPILESPLICFSEFYPVFQEHYLVGLILAGKFHLDIKSASRQDACYFLSSKICNLHVNIKGRSCSYSSLCNRHILVKDWPLWL